MHSPGGWIIDGTTWAENPRLTLPLWLFGVVDLWFLAMGQRSMMTPRALPCPGSVGEQPAALMDAFALLDAMAAKTTEGANDAGAD